MIILTTNNRKGDNVIKCDDIDDGVDNDDDDDSNNDGYSIGNDIDINDK